MKRGVMRSLVLSLVVLSLALPLFAWVGDAAAKSPHSFRSGSRATREEAPTWSIPPDDGTPIPRDGRSTVKKAPKPLKQTKPWTWRRMLRSFLRSGLIGSVFYGRGFGGVGLLEVVALSGLIALAYRALARYQAEPGANLAAAGAGAVMLGAPPAGSAASVDSREALEEGLARIQETDPLFDAGRFTKEVEEIFRQVQAAWTARDIAQASAVLTVGMRDRLEREIARLKALGRVNRVESITVRRVSVVQASQHAGWDRVGVQIVASLIDYTTNEGGLKVLQGNPFEPVPFSERWELVRPSGPHPWQLDAIQ